MMMMITSMAMVRSSLMSCSAPTSSQVTSGTVAKPSLLAEGCTLARDAWKSDMRMERPASSSSDRVSVLFSSCSRQRGGEVCCLCLCDLSVCYSLLHLSSVCHSLLHLSSVCHSLLHLSSVCHSLVSLSSTCYSIFSGAPSLARCSSFHQNSVHGAHGCFPAQSHEVGPHVARSEAGQLLEVKVLRQLQLPTQRLQDPAEQRIRDPQADLSVEAPRSAQGGVQGVRPVGGPDHHHLSRHRQTVQVCQEESSTALSSTHPRHSLGQQGLSTAGGSVQEEAPGRNHPQALVHLRVTHVDQQLTHLLQQ
ncbi:hypothetical protein F7725_024367, partial [Dissostichus mawsoni]